MRCVVRDVCLTWCAHRFDEDTFLQVTTNRYLLSIHHSFKGFVTFTNEHVRGVGVRMLTSRHSSLTWHGNSRR
jgi:hypothetical protein